MQWPDLLITTKIRTFLFKNGKWSDFYECENEVDYYGITWSEDTLFVACAKHILIPHSSQRLYEKRSRDIHQIYYHDGRIYITNTTENTIDALNIKTGEIEDDILKTGGHGPGDQNHLNSIFIEDSGNMWICAHNNHKNPSYLEEYDTNRHRVRKITDVGCCNHNVFVENGFAYTQNSNTGCMMKINLKDDNKEALSFINTAGIGREYRFGRGMAKTKNNFIFAMNRWAAIQDSRENSFAFIVLTDNDLNLIEHIKLPIAAQVKDIRVISERDYCHNDIPFPKGLV